MQEPYHITETPKENPNSFDWLLTGFVHNKVALFKTGTALFVKKEEKNLSKKNIYAIVIRNPNAKDIEILSEYEYGPTYVTWHTPTSSYFDRLDKRLDIEGGLKRKKAQSYRWKLNTTKNYTVETGELKEGDFFEWYKIYEKVVVGKEHGIRLIPKNFLDNIKEARENFYQIIFKDKKGDIVAGLIIENIIDKKILKIRASAADNSRENTNKHFMIRGQEELFNLAKKVNTKTMSYGTDPALYGETIDVGLEHFKASLGYKPVFEVDNEEQKEFIKSTRLIKIINQTKPYLLFTFSKRGDPDSDLEIKLNQQTPPKVYGKLWQKRI